MNASQGRDPARPQQGNGAGGAKNTSAAAQPRLSREAVVAFVLLPVLLAAGFFLGGRLLGEDSPTEIDAAPVDASPTAEGPAAPGTDPTADPSADPSTDPGASPTEVPPVVGPTAPSPEPTEAPSPEPTEAPSPEVTEAPTQAPSPEVTAEPTQAPTAEPTQAPSPEPTQPTQPPIDPNQALPSDPGLLEEVVPGIPQPAAGNDVLLFPGFSSDDVRAWQARMVERGWDLQVDGIYGERTVQVAQSFQLEKGLVVDGLVGPETWSAAWTAPIT